MTQTPERLADEHALDKSLGDIHECAVAAELMGIPGLALKLANAHEKLQNYVIAQDDALEAAEAREKVLRKLLWLRHGCPFHALYGDDGEMQCHQCGIDFRRDEPQEVYASFTAIGKAALNSVPSTEQPKA